jgi:hypothetical protein
MVMRYAIVERGVVVNVAVADAPLAANWIITDTAGPGWTYADGVFSPPAPKAPTQAEQEAARQAAYTAEADPLFFKWQAGEATEAEWLAKRQEIRDRYPYPEATV